MSKTIAKAAERLIEENDKLQRLILPSSERHSVNVMLAQQVGELARLVRNIANER